MSNFNRARLDYTTYLTMNRDFLGRISTLRLDGSVGWIFSGSMLRPMNGSTSVAGRCVASPIGRSAPRGTPAKPGGPTDIPIGGDFLLFLGAQYQFPDRWPTSSMESFFIDSGTVNDSPGFDEYRIGVGAGVRVYIPAARSDPHGLRFCHSAHEAGQ